MILEWGGGSSHMIKSKESGLCFVTDENNERVEYSTCDNASDKQKWEVMYTRPYNASEGKDRRRIQIKNVSNGKCVFKHSRVGDSLNENQLMLRDCNENFFGSNDNSDWNIKEDAANEDSYKLHVGTDGNFCIHDRTAEMPKVNNCSDNKSSYLIEGLNIK